MIKFVSPLLIVLAVLIRLVPLEAASSEAREVDSPHSTMTVHVYKSGLFSAFGHNHEIQAPIESGQVKEAERDSTVVLRVDARKLKVLDPDDAKSRPQVQETMLGAQVLDVNRFPEIRFQSTSIEPKGQEHWMVHGKLALHGVEHLISFEVTRKDDRYRGSATLKQTDFGMTPVTIAGGTVKVKDEVKVEFEIALMK